MSDERLLTAIKASEASVAALRSLRQAQVEALRKREVSWAEIGKALGVSRQAAWERFS
jgi:predicted transcriptional regulator